MANQQEWFDKLTSFVPKWMFQQNQNTTARFWALAKVMAVLDEVRDNHVNETFITLSSGEFLELNGKDRNKVQDPDETDEAFKSRIRNLSNSVSLPAIKALVDSLLIKGESTIIENHSAENFCDAGAFVDVNIIQPGEYLYNYFTILVDHQIPVPETFCDVDAFCDGNYITGATDSDIQLFIDIVNAVNKNKALGTEYSLCERIH